MTEEQRQALELLREEFPDYDWELLEEGDPNPIARDTMKAPTLYGKSFEAGVFLMDNELPGAAFRAEGWVEELINPCEGDTLVEAMEEFQKKAAKHIRLV